MMYLEKVLSAINSIGMLLSFFKLQTEFWAWEISKYQHYIKHCTSAESKSAV